MANTASTLLGTKSPVPPSAVMTLVDFVPLGDGTFRAVPRKPIQRGSISQAVKLTGLTRDTIYRLFLTGFIDGVQPTPKKITLDIGSLAKHLEAVKDPEFWTAERLQRLRSAGR